MPLHVIRRPDLDQYIEATEASGTKIVSVSPDFADPGSFLVVTEPQAERGQAEIEVRS